MILVEIFRGVKDFIALRTTVSKHHVHVR